MHQSQHSSDHFGGELTVGLGLWYDSERLMLEGVYLDEVTAYRARKGWIEAFEANFLLEEKIDFRVRVVPNAQPGRFSVLCEFITACGRYAFWRLTHHQAPEVQFILETAHLPAFSGIPETPVTFGSLEVRGHDDRPRPQHDADSQPEVWERIRDICSAIMATTGSLLKGRPRR